MMIRFIFKILFAISIFLSAVNLLTQVLPLEYSIRNNNFDKILSLNSTDRFRTNSFRTFNLIPDISATIISNFITDIIVFGDNMGDTIWFGTGKGISRTTNLGLSFQNYYGTEPFRDDDVSGIAVYKNWVVVATAYSQVINEQNVPTGSGIKVSSDFGVTWVSYPQPKDTQADTLITYGISTIRALAIVVSEFNLSYDIAITRKNLTSDSLVFWITSWAGGLRKSTDYGATWQRVILPPDGFNFITPSGGPYNFQLNPRDPPLGNNNHKAFSVTAENDSTIYVGTANGINVSTDWGVSWRKYNYDSTGQGTGVSGDFVVGLSVQKFSGRSIVWAACNPTKSGEFSAVSYTMNSGINWANTLREAQFPHNVGFRDSIIYVATDNGIWRSFFTPPDFRWSKPSVIYDETVRDKISTERFYSVNSQGDSIWVGSGDGLARTTDTLPSPWVSKWKIFRAYQGITSVNETYAAPNPFSPDDELCRIFFKTGKTTSQVTVKIFDFAMFPVRTVIQNATRNLPDVIWVSWDGKRDDGTQVSNGVYFYRIEIDKDEVIWGKILVLQ